MSLVAAPTTSLPTRSLWSEAWWRLCRNRLAVPSGVILLVITFLSLAGPFLAETFLHVNSKAQNLALVSKPPSAEHWFGTDANGRDLLARILEGGRVSLAVGLISTLVSLLIGVSYGVFSGFRGGATDRLMMRVVDILDTLPFTIFLILLTVAFSEWPPDAKLYLMFAAIGAVEWLGMARVIRSQTLALRNQDFVHAANVLGRSDPAIMVRHLLPNLAGLIIVYATLTVPRVIMLESFISFLGLGADLSWGSLIKDGADAMESYPWQLIFPSLFFSTSLFCLNFLGDGLRDALDPRSAK